MPDAEEIPRQLTAAELQSVRGALATRPDWFSLSQQLTGLAKDSESPGLEAIGMAFVYDLVPIQDQDRRERSGGPYAAMWESGDERYPPRPDEVSSEIRELWRTTLDAIVDPIAQARLADLLYVATGPSAHALGRRAAGALVALTDEEAWEPIYRAECIGRALEILAELNDREELVAAGARAVSLVERFLTQEHAGPPFVALRAVIALKPSNRPDDLPRLLEAVIARFAGTTHEVAALGIAADAATDPQVRAAFHRRQLDARIAEARRADGLAKVALLQRAIEFARTHNLHADAASLLHELQETPQSELGLETLEVSTELPSEEIRQEVDRLCGSGASDAFDALRRLGAGMEPPGGSNADVDAEVDKQRRDHPMMDLFGETVVGADTAAPQFIANTEESKRRTGRARQRRLYADFIGSVFVGPMLDEIPTHHGRPSHHELTQHFTTPLIDEVRAGRIARALELFWDGEYDASAHVLVPRLEAVLRNLARARGITIVKPVTEGRFGGAISLNAVMTKLRELDPDVPWLDYLEALLCDPVEINLRNVIAHGLAPEIGGTSAALLLHAACWLALLAREDQVGAA
jgi:hypothetical protein